jgi:acetyltransferase-like isoleucine patch superfamily enzyme
LRLNKNSLITKAFGLMRFIFTKFYHLNNLKIDKVSYFGKGVKVYIQNKGTISIKGKIRVNGYVELQSRGKLIIGENCFINDYSRIVSFNEITIGNKVVIAQFVTILDHDHASSIKDGILAFGDYVTAKITIGNNVWIGDKVTILKGTSIGNNVVIAANSLVNSEIPSNCIVGGVPAKILKQL